LVDDSIVACGSPWTANIPERGVVRSRQLFKFWWAPTISLEQLKLQSSNFVHRWVMPRLNIRMTKHP